MKKFLLLVAAVVACVLGMAAQQTLTVHDGANTSNTVPIYGYWCDSYLKCEFVMPADELAAMNGKEIQQLTWYLNEAPTGNGWGNGTFQIFMKEVEGTTLSAFTGTEGASVVYEGTLDVVDKQELAIEFTEPYTYSGGNLLIGVYHITKGTYMSATFVGEIVEGACVQGRNGSSLDDVTATQTNFLPKTTFTYGDPQPYAASVLPAALDFGKIYIGNSNVLNVKVKNIGLNAFTPSVTVAAPFSTTYEAAEVASGAEVEIPVTFAPTAVGDYSGELTIACGDAGNFTVALTGKCSDELELVVCDATNTSAYAPVYGYNYDCQDARVQMIYPAEMLADLEGAEIYGVKYHLYYNLSFGGGEVQMSLGTTEDTEFTLGDEAIENPATGLTAVATNNPTAGDTSFEFTFTNPYKYEGGNLVVETLVTEAGSYGSTNFYGVPTEVNSSWYEYEGNWGSGFNVVKFLPKMTIMYKKAEETEATYSVVGFNDWQNPIEITADGAVVEASAQNFDDPEDTAQEFKIITIGADDKTVWYGGADENNVGYFLLGSDLMGVNITLDDAGANFRLAEPGNYTIKIVKDEAVTPAGKAPVEGIKMVVTKNTVTAIETVKSDVKGDNNYYNLMGQKMNGDNLPAGIYIHNGKKIIVR